MKWATGLSVVESLEGALDDALESLQPRLDGVPPDLVVAFVDGYDDAERLPELLAARLPGARLLGCSAGGVVAEGRELEDTRALSLTGAVLPGVEVRPFHVSQRDLPPESEPEAWRRLLGVPGLTEAHAIVLPDPYSCDAPRLVRGLDGAFPAGTRIGGLASGGVGPGGNCLFLDEATHRSGAVGVLLTGNVVVDALVAQGCRPIGQPMFVTRCRGNVVQELDGEPAGRVLQALYDGLPPEEQALFRQALFLGLVMDPGGEVYRPGDFLIRNLLGLDAETGALVVGAHVEPNGVVQFHVRDAQASADELEAMLRQYRNDSGNIQPSGGLLFSCLGRGAGLFGEPDHDTRALLRHLGPVPLGGFFCNGEIGPVRGRTFVHGYTSAFALFRPRGGAE